MTTATPMRLEARLVPQSLPDLRRRLGVTQEQLAEQLGTSAQEVCRLERALRPGGLLDQLLAELLEAPTLQEPTP